MMFSFSEQQIVLSLFFGSMLFGLVISYLARIRCPVCRAFALKEAEVDLELDATRELICRRCRFRQNLRPSHFDSTEQ
jgi:DNA-directed RNA polymerase subunit RPC12/RpoP